MELKQLQSLVDAALADGVPEAIVEYCGQYYSPYYLLLFLLALQRPTFAVELGVDVGRGAHAMLIGGARVVSVDNDVSKTCPGIMATDLCRYFTLIHASSTPMPELIRDMESEINLLVIDTEHSYTQAKNEFEEYAPRLKDGAIVVFDDTNAMEGDVLRYVESLPYEKIVEDRLHPSCGMAVMIYRKAK